MLEILKFDGLVGISEDIPTTLAPKLIISKLSQLPLKPVWPVIKTVLLLKIFITLIYL
jgi:hypothetical protein